jgi:bacterioferritin
MAQQSDFVIDVELIRRRAREHIERGAVTPDYQGSVETGIKILNEALATEIVCVLRYKFHAVTAQGIDSEAVRREFEEHAQDEMRHAAMIAERIDQLGGKPNFNPEGLLTRSHSHYAEGRDLIDMIKENLVAERIAVESYREMVRFFSMHDPTSRRMMEKILAQEEEHATDMHDLLVAHEGRPMLPH